MIQSTMGSSIPITFLRSLIIFIVFTKTSTAQAPNYVGDDCHNRSSAQRPLSASYQANLNDVLSWLLNDAATSKGYNHTTVGGGSNAVYGLYDCRGDITGYFCQFCVSTAAREAFQRCPDRASAVIWYDFCILRYSNKNFFGNVTTTPSWQAWRPPNVSDPTELAKALSYIRDLIRRATEETKQLFAMGGFDVGGGKTRYGMVQCSRDLSDKGCEKCLKAVVDKVPQCCKEKQGWQVLGPSCFIKYDDYMFYLIKNQITSSPTSPAPNPGSSGVDKSKEVIISICVMVAVAILSCNVYCCWRRKLRKYEMPSETTPMFLELPQRDSPLNIDLPIISLISIQQSTHNFSEASKLGEGGFGPVYKGTLPDGREIAIKRLSKTSCQGSEEFRNEVLFIAKLQHRNLVRLLGCCIEETEKLLAYEYMPNSSLDFHLFNELKRKKLDWKLRLSIINGIARGLLYLHEDSRLRVIHRDLKASNVLLDHEMNPKISDFGLARAFEGGQNQGNTTRVMGTYGYMAPEYAMEGLFSVKSDVFSFGVRLLEIICGKRNSGFYLSEHGQSILTYAGRLWCEDKCLELIDPILEESCTKSEVLKCIHIALLCVQEDAADRPTMSIVVVMLASDTMSLPKPNQPAFSIGRMTMDESSTSKNSKDPSINEVTVSYVMPR